MAKDLYVPVTLRGNRLEAKAQLGQTVIVTEGPEKYTPAPITPSESQQTIPTKDKQLTADVVVEPIPSEYIIPTGTEVINVTENGTVSRDVSAKETVTVNTNVPIPPGYIVPTGNLGITENGQYDITEKASVNVDVPAPAYNVEHGSFISNREYLEIKIALLNCFRNVAWINGNGQQYYDNLYNALYEGTIIASITAVYDPGSAVITEDDSLSTLVPYLTVTATYDGGNQRIITDYELSGHLDAGTNVITIQKDGVSTTVSVTAVALSVLNVHPGYTVDTDDADNIIANAKRCVSDIIPFSNTNPIVIQKTNAEYACALKNITPENKIDPNGASYSPDNGEPGQTLGMAGWITSNVQNTVWRKKSGHIYYTFSTSKGTCRLIFANATDNTASLPANPLSGYVTVSGSKYRLVTAQ